MSYHQHIDSIRLDPANPYSKYLSPSVVMPPLSNSISNGTTSSQSHHDGASQSPRSRSRTSQGPFELSATPVRHRRYPCSTNQHGPSNQRPQHDWRNALNRKLDELDKKLNSVQHSLDISTEQSYDNNLCRLITLPKADSPAPTKNDTTYQPKTLPFPPPYPQPPPSISRESFIKQLRSDGLEYLLPYIDDLDSDAEYAVAPTTNSKYKRCRVGRPRGKILRANQTDDLERGLCSKHKDAEGTRLRMEAGEGAWVCYPVNREGE